MLMKFRLIYLTRTLKLLRCLLIRGQLKALFYQKSAILLKSPLVVGKALKSPLVANKALKNPLVARKALKSPLVVSVNKLKNNLKYVYPSRVPAKQASAKLTMGRTPLWGCGPFLKGRLKLKILNLNLYDLN